MTWLLACASLTATWLNVRKVRACFGIWALTNAAWCVVDVHYRVWARAPLDAIYCALAVWGWFAWRDDAPPSGWTGGRRG